MQDDAEFEEIKKGTLKLIVPKQEELFKTLDRLEGNAEWEKLTIAFFGETNAGKSTLIEALRLLFKETSKLKEQNRFKENLERLPALEQELQVIQQSIDTQRERKDKVLGEFECQREATQEQLDRLEMQYVQAQDALEEELQTARTQAIQEDLEVCRLEHKRQELNKELDQLEIQHVQKQASFWFALLAFLGFNSLAKRIQTLKTLLEETAKQHEKALARVLTQQESHAQKRRAQHQKTEQPQIQKAQENLRQLELKYQKDLASIERVLEQDNKQLKNLQAQQAQIKQEQWELADGAIIGDGTLDYTKQFISYQFSARGVAFDLLDVPGIEGDEQSVQEEIIRAVQKAHVIFYIARGTKVETGSAEQFGTLEKIKDYLHQQSKVYTLFNKSVKNPIQLKTSLVSADEEASLRVLDNKLAEVLGPEHYGGHKNVCAFVAFLALAECLCPNHANPKKDFYKNQQNFLKTHQPETLLEWAGFRQLGSFIQQELLVEVPAQIKQANYRKVSESLQDCVKTLKTLEEQSHALLVELDKEVQNTAFILKDILQEVRPSLGRIITDVLEDFKRANRKKIYAYIENNVKDEEFKNKLKSTLEESCKGLGEVLGNRVKESMEAFQARIVEALDRCKRRLKVIEMSTQAHFKESGYDYSWQDFDMDSGIDGWGLAGAVAGGVGLWVFIAATNFWNVLGWITLAAGAIATLWGTWESLRKWLSDDYKKSKQREKCDQVIANVIKEIQEQIKENMRGVYDKAQEYTQQCTHALNKPLEQRKQVHAHIQAITLEWEGLAEQIQREGKQGCKKL
ncbi:coiled-coil domain-containing protein [Helicobacter bizzozeronii]|uniref:hypothetical protein n=1 Tax=Helicobacter bizzozeronii TaxID=56877 RepID=UPI0013159FF0|nr:hypothetical protein [Helicobacter bizzozeronii]